MDVKAIKKRVIYLESETEKGLIDKGYSYFAAKKMKGNFKETAKNMRKFLKIKIKKNG